VILITGAPSAEGANAAVEAGALLYMVKPVEFRALLQMVSHALRLHRMAKLKRDALAHLGNGTHEVGDRAGLEVRFADALSSIWIAFQPIVHWRSRSVFGYEALMRCDQPALRNPAALLDAAERLGRVFDLGQVIRRTIAASLDGAPAGAQIFVNLHPNDLADPALFDGEGPLYPYAERIVLEITERASLGDVKDVPARVTSLRRSGFRIAIDDLGAGYAGLTAFAHLTPEAVKLDMGLVRDVHKEPVKQKLIAAMTALCREMAMLVIAEGVETAEERDVLADLGCELMQGYLFGRPARGFAPVTF
jgi:EAL domain-containing protein (putative c-di-GMP-specific phosphodiesterase class I)